MLADPCRAQLSGAVYGSSESGYVTRFHSHFTIVLADITSNGYLIWFPDFISQAGDTTAIAQSPGSLVGFSSESSGDVPVNTQANPQFQSPVVSSTRGGAYKCPIHDWVTSNTVQDYRTIATCLQMTFTGAISTTAGRIGKISGISPEILLDHASGGNEAASIDNMMDLSTYRTRTATHTLEIKSRPSETSEMFRSADVKSYANAVVYNLGYPGTSATTVSTTSTQGTPKGIGYVWEALPSTGAIVFDLTQIIEWRPQQTAGISNPPSVSLSASNEMAKAVRALDQRKPGWDFADMINQAGKDVGYIIDAAQAGYKAYKSVSKGVKL